MLVFRYGSDIGVREMEAELNPALTQRSHGGRGAGTAADMKEQLLRRIWRSKGMHGLMVARKRLDAKGFEVSMGNRSRSSFSRMISLRYTGSCVSEGAACRAVVRFLREGCFAERAQDLSREIHIGFSGEAAHGALAAPYAK